MTASTRPTLPATAQDYEAATTTALVTAAQRGDERAWSAIVQRYSPIVWSITAGFRLDSATRQDVAQIVWVKLLDHLDRIREPERLRGWLATTTRRQCVDAGRCGRRVVPLGDGLEAVLPATVPEDDLTVTGSEREALRRAFNSLPPAMQLLIRLVMIEPSLGYRRIADILDRPVGSIGPSRARALQRLRRSYVAELGKQGRFGT